MSHGRRYDHTVSGNILDGGCLLELRGKPPPRSKENGSCLVLLALYLGASRSVRGVRQRRECFHSDNGRQQQELHLGPLYWRLLRFCIDDEDADPTASAQGG